MTRFSIPTCLKCCYIGRPVVKGETSGFIGQIPIFGDIAAMKDAATRTLHCAKCGEPFTKSLTEKAGDLKGALAGKIADLKESMRAAPATGQFCVNCGNQLSAGAKFCSGCGGSASNSY